MKRRGSDLAWAVAAGALLATGGFGQVCPMPCIGNMVLCHHQNGIRNHRGEPATAIEGPNAATGNVLGDAFWKIWGCENGMTRGNLPVHFTSWEIGAANTGTATASFNLPDLVLRSVTLVGSTPDLREPNLAAPPLYAAAVGDVALPTGGFRLNVSIATPAVALPGSCPPTTGLPGLWNEDVAMLFLLTPGEATGTPTYFRNLRTSGEVNTVSNPTFVWVPGPGNSYSGAVDAALGVVSHFPIDQELFAQMGFFEPTLEVHRLTPGFAASSRGSGARELAAGDSFSFVSRDWQARTLALSGMDRLAAVVIADDSLGNPLCNPMPWKMPGSLPGNLFLPGSSAIAAIIPTQMTVDHLGFSATLGAWLNCHVADEPAPGCGLCPCQPTTSSVVQAPTPLMQVPSGLSGMVIYAAAFYLNLATLTLDEASNTVELLFL